jgi:competence protein ComEC
MADPRKVVGPIGELSGIVNAALEAIESEVRRTPMMRMALPFMAGLLVGRAFAPDPGTAWWIAGPVSVALLPVLAMKHPFARRWVRGALLCVVGSALGVLWWSLRDPFRGTPVVWHDVAVPPCWLAEIGEPSYVVERSARFEARVLEGRGASAEWTGRRVFLTLVLDGPHRAPARGDRMWIAIGPHPIDRVPEPGGFDGRSYAASRGISGEAYAPADGWIRVAHAGHWTDPFASARARIAGWLAASGLPRRERGLAKALLIGVRDELDPDQKTAFARSGTMHVLAVSGMHVGLIWAVISALLARFGNRRTPRIARGIVILFVLWAYAGLTGGEASVLRATVMCSLFTIGGIVLRASGHLNSLFAAAFLLLLWDPLLLWQLGFQLSFLAVLGIILFYKPLLRLWHPPGAVPHYAWSAAAVSLAAQVATTPLTMLVFKSFPVWFLPANILVVGVVSIAVYGSILHILLFHVPLLGAAITSCMEQLLLFLGWSTAFFAELPGAYPAVRIDTFMCLLLYMAVISLAAFAFWPGRGTRWSIALVCIGILCNWAWNAHRVNHTVRLTLHAVPERDLLSLQTGRALLMVGDTMIRNDPSMRRRLEVHERSTGAMLDRMLPWPSDERNDAAVLDLGPFRVGLAGPRPARRRAPLKVDLLYLTGVGRYDMLRLHEVFDPKTAVVISPTVNGLERWRIREWCAEKGIACHDLERQGACILEQRI